MQLMLSIVATGAVVCCFHHLSSALLKLQLIPWNLIDNCNPG